MWEEHFNNEKRIKTPTTVSDLIRLVMLFHAVINLVDHH
jgi:hypothetical protein